MGHELILIAGLLAANIILLYLVVGQRNEERRVHASLEDKLEDIKDILEVMR